MKKSIKSFCPHRIKKNSNFWAMPLKYHNRNSCECCDNIFPHWTTVHIKFCPECDNGVRIFNESTLERTGIPNTEAHHPYYDAYLGPIKKGFLGWLFK